MNTLNKTIYIDDPVKRKLKVGFLKKTKSGLLFRKDVVRSKHFMRIVQGYGIQKEVFDKYLRGKKGRIAIKEVDTGKYLVASIDTWSENSKSGNYGDGKQIFLAERYMHNSENFDRGDKVSDAPVVQFEINVDVYLSSQSRLSKMYKNILAKKGLE